MVRLTVKSPDLLIALITLLLIFIMVQGICIVMLESAGINLSKLNHVE